MATRTRFYHHQVVRAREPASFWRENVEVFVILLGSLRNDDGDSNENGKKQ